MNAIALAERAEAWLEPGDTPEPEALAELFAWWLAARGAAALPPAAAIDPFALRPMLGRLLLVDVEPGDDPRRPRFPVRLHGTELVERFGYSLARRSLADVPDPGYAAVAQIACTRVVKHRRPYWNRYDPPIDAKPLWYRSLILPFRAAESDDVARLMLAFVFDD